MGSCVNNNSQVFVCFLLPLPPGLWGCPRMVLLCVSTIMHSFPIHALPMRRGVLQLPTTNNSPLPSFLSLFIFHSFLGLSSFSLLYDFDNLNCSRQSLFPVFSECSIPINHHHQRHSSHLLSTYHVPSARLNLPFINLHS